MRHPPRGRPEFNAEASESEPNTIIVRLPEHEVMTAVGPLIRAEWHVPKDLRHLMERRRQRVPGPVKGYMLIDTGAGATGIAAHAAEKLGLNVIGVEPNFGVGGLQMLNRYFARFVMGIEKVSSTGKVQIISREYGVCETRELDKYSDRLNEMKPPGYDLPINLIGLLGRDFLRWARFTYDGPARSFKLEWLPAAP